MASAGRACSRARGGPRLGFGWAASRLRESGLSAHGLCGAVLESAPARCVGLPLISPASTTHPRREKKARPCGGSVGGQHVARDTRLGEGHGATTCREEVLNSFVPLINSVTLPNARSQHPRRAAHTHSQTRMPPSPGTRTKDSPQPRTKSPPRRLHAGSPPCAGQRQ